jgi:predicted RNA polymerase sigma factor
VRLNRAVALRYVAGPQAALDEIEALAPKLDGYHLFHAIRGDLLVELGRREQARAAELRALALTGNSAKRSLLQQRLLLLDQHVATRPRLPTGAQPQGQVTNQSGVRVAGGEQEGGA